MCTYVTNQVTVAGAALDRTGAVPIQRAVVCFDHPQEVALEHALCIDFRGGDPATRVAVELDAESARRLAEAILATLDDPEVIPLVAARP